MTRNEIFALEDNEKNNALKAYITKSEESAGLFIEGFGTKLDDGRAVEMHRFTSGVVLAFRNQEGEVRTVWISEEAAYLLSAVYTKLFTRAESRAQYLRCCELTGTTPEPEES